jgi:chlorobactene glucosyltransferase
MWNIYQAAVTICLAVFIINLILNLRSLHRLGRKDGPLPDPLPFISVLIPARNEESNIGNCLESLRRQVYPHYEILVLDDGSSDRTSDIVKEISETDPRVRLLSGRPLPAGWAGKPYACYQLSMEAKGSWLLFTDADTIHAPEMLRSALAYSHNHGVSLLSGFPLQHTVSFAQRVAIPMMYFFILSCLPLWWVQRSKRPRTGIAIGQFLFFNADDYRAMGGHESVKSRILEDLWLGLETVRSGKRQGVVDLTGMVSCRMYERLGPLWEGMGKWFYSITSMSPWLFAVIIIAVFGVFILPFIIAVGRFTPGLPDYGFSMLIVLQIAFIFLMRIITDHRFRHSQRYFLLQPISIMFWITCGVSGLLRRLTGRGARWKQREYKPGSKVE